MCGAQRQRGGIRLKTLFTLLLLLFSLHCPTVAFRFPLIASYQVVAPDNASIPHTAHLSHLSKTLGKKGYLSSSRRASKPRSFGLFSYARHPRTLPPWDPLEGVQGVLVHPALPGYRPVARGGASLAGRVGGMGLLGAPDDDPWGAQYSHEEAEEVEDDENDINEADMDGQTDLRSRDDEDELEDCEERDLSDPRPIAQQGPTSEVGGDQSSQRGTAGQGPMPPAAATARKYADKVLWSPHMAGVDSVTSGLLKRHRDEDDEGDDGGHDRAAKYNRQKGDGGGHGQYEPGGGHDYDGEYARGGGRGRGDGDSRDGWREGGGSSNPPSSWKNGKGRPGRHHPSTGYGSSREGQWDGAWDEAKTGGSGVSSYSHAPSAGVHHSSLNSDSDGGPASTDLSDGWYAGKDNDHTGDDSLGPGGDHAYAADSINGGPGSDDNTSNGDSSDNAVSTSEGDQGYSTTSHKSSSGYSGGGAHRLAQSAYGTPSRSDCSRLMQFYRASSQSTNGWVQDRGWGDEDDQECCEWYGVSCDPVTRRVTALELSGNGLTGQLSNYLFALDALLRVDLSHNNLVSIPDRFATLDRLTHLNLSSSALSGSIPPSLFSSSSLINLDLSHNQLSGTLDLTSPSLRILDVSDNQLTSVRIGSEPNARLGLTKLLLSDNLVTGALPDLVSLTGLRVFDGSNNSTGSIPDLSPLTNLTRFDARVNQLTGTLPSLPDSLQSLYLSSNSLTGGIPAIPAPPHLTSCYLLPNPFSPCPSPAELSDPTSLASRCHLDTCGQSSGSTASDNSQSVIDPLGGSTTKGIPVFPLPGETLGQPSVASSPGSSAQDPKAASEMAPSLGQPIKPLPPMPGTPETPGNGPVEAQAHMGASRLGSSARSSSTVSAVYISLLGLSGTIAALAWL
ncbi:hypothetical protein IAU60_003393 [Kwoniella sp. DSM 27419]